MEKVTSASPRVGRKQLGWLDAIARWKRPHRALAQPLDVWRGTDALSNLIERLPGLKGGATLYY